MTLSVHNSPSELNVSPEMIHAAGYEAMTFILNICGGDVKQAPKLRHLKVCDYHGALDTTVPTSRSRDMIAALRTAGCAQILYREVPDAAHNAWDAAFADDTAFDFIFSPEE